MMDSGALQDNNSVHGLQAGLGPNLGGAAGQKAGRITHRLLFRYKAAWVSTSFLSIMGPWATRQKKKIQCWRVAFPVLRTVPLQTSTTKQPQLKEPRQKILEAPIQKIQHHGLGKEEPQGDQKVRKD